MSQCYLKIHHRNVENYLFYVLELQLEVFCIENLRSVRFTMAQALFTDGISTNSIK